MGGVVSSSRSNDELIDNLLGADYIRSSEIERVFRAVDRAEYFLPDYRGNAYKDVAWKSGNLHLSAPCIYSEVMEGLDLHSGLSFLNLGSGTGYLSTMVGLILGINGINHGVEIYEDVIEYANKKLQDFKRLSGAIDEFDFCEPKFIKGNCLCLSTDTRRYDRIYCGAACPPSYLEYMRNLLKIGGILVMPLEDQLLQVKRTMENKWDVRQLLPVSFASLVQPREGEETIHLMEVNAGSLQVLSRSVIRNLLRKQITFDYPNLKSGLTTKKTIRRRPMKKYVVPIFDTSDEDSDDDREMLELGRVRAGNENGPNRRKELSTVIELVLGKLRERTGRFSTEEEQATNEENENQSDEAVDESNDNASKSNNEEDHSSASSDCEITGVEPGCSGGLKYITLTGKREKFDSGLGEEIVEQIVSSSDSSDLDDQMDVDDSNDNTGVRTNKRTSKPQTAIRTGGKWRRINLSSHAIESESSSDSSDVEEPQVDGNESRIISSKYTLPMKCKIQELPLPPVLKRYLNYNREM